MYLKLRPYRQVSVAKKRNEKLAQRYFRPYQITQRIGQVAYKLQLPPHSNIHPVLHVSQLKFAVHMSHQSQELPVILTSNLKWATELELLLDVRKAESGFGIEVLVQWKRLPSFESTWKALSTLVEQFPDCNLEDKISSLRASIDRLWVPLAFMKRKKRGKGMKTRAWGKKSHEESEKSG